MNSETPRKPIVLAVLLAVVGVTLLVLLNNARRQPPAELPSPKLVRDSVEYHYTPPTPKDSTRAEAVTNDDTNDVAPPKIAREKVEAWLTKHSRNAASLLAAFRALDDTNYLNEAATNFPNDPRVEMSVLAHNEFPQERRKWLDLLKASSPSNSLANYLSAEDHFKNGKSDEAVKELVAASGKSQFQNYALETILNGEELFSESDTPVRLAASYAMSGMSDENMPQLASFKIVARGIGDVMKQKTAAGDAASAGDLAQLGLDFAGKINSGDSGKLLINQMVGTASASIVLSQLDQNTAYDFLNGQTPAQAADTLKQQKVELRKLMSDFSPAQMQMMMSESETASYMQRLKIYGEVEAMKWVIQQHPPADPKK